MTVSTRRLRRCAPLPWSIAKPYPTRGMRQVRPTRSGCTGWCGKVAAARCADAVRENALAHLIEAIRSLYPKGVFDDPRTWRRARRLDGLAMPLVGNNAVVLAGAEKAAAYLMNRL